MSQMLSYLSGGILILIGCAISGTAQTDPFVSKEDVKAVFNVKKVRDVILDKEKLKEQSIKVIGFLGTASNRNEHLLLQVRNTEPVFDKSADSILLSEGSSVTKLNGFLENGFNNLFIGELVVATGKLQVDSNGDIALKDVTLEMTLLKEKARIAKLLDFIN